MPRKKPLLIAATTASVLLIVGAAVMWFYAGVRVAGPGLLVGSVILAVANISKLRQIDENETVEPQRVWLSVLLVAGVVAIFFATIVIRIASNS